MTTASNAPTKQAAPDEGPDGEKTGPQRDFPTVLTVMVTVVSLIAAISNWHVLKTNYQRTLVISGALILVVVLTSLLRSRDFYTWRRLADLAGVAAVFACAALLIVSIDGHSVTRIRTIIVKVPVLPNPPVASLTSPVPGSQVSQSAGFTAGGHAARLGSDTIWILDKDSTGYTADQQAATSGLNWSAQDNDLGNPGQRLPFTLTMVAVLADKQCSTFLGNELAGQNDYFSSLPAGCTSFGQVTVDVVRK